MSNDWRHPGEFGAVLYAVGAAVLGAAWSSVISRLSIARQRGRRRAALALPAGGIIVVSNHASYADGVLLALVCRRLGRSLRLLATVGVFRAPLLGRFVRRLGFIPVERKSRSARDRLSSRTDCELQFERLQSRASRRPEPGTADRGTRDAFQNERRIRDDKTRLNQAGCECDQQCPFDWRRIARSQPEPIRIDRCDQVHLPLGESCQPDASVVMRRVPWRDDTPGLHDLQLAPTQLMGCALSVGPDPGPKVGPSVDRPGPCGPVCVCFCMLFPPNRLEGRQGLSSYLLQPLASLPRSSRYGSFISRQ